MEFIFNEVLPICIWVSWTWFVYAVGHYVAKKKFQPHGKAPKVSTNKCLKEFCECDARDMQPYEEDNKTWCPQCGLEVS